MPPPSLRVERSSTTLRDQVVERLRDAICEEHFPPGARLVERQLCEMLGVSRTLAREALRQLEAEGFVVTVPHRGPAVATVDRSTARSIYEVRAALEGLAGSLFVERADDRERQALADAVARYRATDDDSHTIRERLQATGEVYDAIFAGTHSDIIASTLRPLSGRINFLRVRSLGVPGRAEEAHREMEDIVDAVTGTDPLRAWSACTIHVERAAACALRTFDQTPGPRATRPR